MAEHTSASDSISTNVYNVGSTLAMAGGGAMCP